MRPVLPMSGKRSVIAFTSGPMRLPSEPLIMIASPARMAVGSVFLSPSEILGPAALKVIVQGVEQRFHMGSAAIHLVDAGGLDRLGQRGMHRARIVAQLKHVPQHRDTARGARSRDFAQHLQRRTNRGGIGIIALVDKQELAARDAVNALRAAPLRRLEAGQRRRGRLDRRRQPA